MNARIVPMLFAVLLFFGCCGQTATGSSSCPYGTYGAACTEICSKARGTEFDGGPNCFSDCMDMVKKAGAGDATTCCKENIRQGCQRLCREEMARIASQYGGGSGEEMAEEIELCIGECTGPFAMMGVNINTICSIPIALD